MRVGSIPSEQPIELREGIDHQPIRQLARLAPRSELLVEHEPTTMSAALEVRSRGRVGLGRIGVVDVDGLLERGEIDRIHALDLRREAGPDEPISTPQLERRA
ncbi:MAG: hypothetical protein HC927_07305 [Deltaproteobacteria bacterium]|nr:hypothetical protein [Deltaproteobacteria bacterium]